jgi:hypothetical protein
MLIKFTTIIAGTILAVTAVILPASAIGTNAVIQQPMNGKTESLLLAGHSKGQSPSKREGHQNGVAQSNEDQNVNPAWKEYKKNGGRLSKNAWKAQGMPRR